MILRAFIVWLGIICNAARPRRVKHKQYPWKTQPQRK
jgi:hypothetical protein